MLKGMKKIFHDSLLKSGKYRYLTALETKKIQEHLLEMASDIVDYTEERGYDLFFVGGSLLGAVRHRGFIPWDDDLDLAMKREHYFRFLEEFANSFRNKYIVVAPNFSSGSQVHYCRIYKIGTKRVTASNEGLNYPQNLFLDLFAIDYAPANPIVRYLKGLFINGIRFIGSSVFRYRHRSRTMRQQASHTFRASILYQLKLTVGFIFSFVGYKSWFNWFDRFSVGKESDLVTIPAGIKFYRGEILPRKVFDEKSYYDFESIKVPGPCDYDTYLANLYGDYWTVPPEGDRERHIIKEILL